VRMWSEAQGGNSLVLHNSLDTQSLVAVGYSRSHFVNSLAKGQNLDKLDDLSVLLSKCDNVEAVNLEKDRALLNAIAAKEAERASRAPEPEMSEEDYAMRLQYAGVSREPAELIAFLAKHKHRL
jgi:hypothetical protein